MVLVLVPVGQEPTLQPAALEALARLGVTSLSLLRDEQLAGLVLEGWALDPAKAVDAAHAAAGACEGARALPLFMQMALAGPPPGGRFEIKGGPNECARS